MNEMQLRLFIFTERRTAAKHQLFFLLVKTRRKAQIKHLTENVIHQQGETPPFVCSDS